MVAPRMGQPNVNQLQNQYLSQGQFPGSGPGVGTAQPGMAQSGAQAGMAQVRGPEVIFLLVQKFCVLKSVPGLIEKFLEYKMPNIELLST